MAADIIDDNDKFLYMIRETERAARNLADHDHLNNPNIGEIIRHRLADFVNDYYNAESVFIKLIKMGLDGNNDSVIIELDE